MHREIPRAAHFTLLKYTVIVVRLPWCWWWDLKPLLTELQMQNSKLHQQGSWQQAALVMCC
jgi:hypothetical protein